MQIPYNHNVMAYYTYTLEGWPEEFRCRFHYEMDKFIYHADYNNSYLRQAVLWKVMNVFKYPMDGFKGGDINE